MPLDNYLVRAATATSLSIPTELSTGSPKITLVIHHKPFTKRNSPLAFHRFGSSGAFSKLGAGSTKDFRAWRGIIGDAQTWTGLASCFSEITAKRNQILSRDLRHEVCPHLEPELADDSMLLDSWPVLGVTGV